MDVHVGNELLFKNDKIKLVHIFLPESLIEHYGITLATIESVYVQTRFNRIYTRCLDSTKFCRVRFKVITLADVYYERDRLLQDLRQLGIFLSIPLSLSKESFYNPFNIAVIKINTTDSDNQVQIPIYYISIVEGLKIAILKTEHTDSDLKSKINNDDVKKVPLLDKTCDNDECDFGREDCFLNKLFNDIRKTSKEVGNKGVAVNINDGRYKESVLRITPGTVLGGLVNQDLKNDVTVKHHPALEEPSVVRGHKILHVIDKEPVNKRVTVTVPVQKIRKLIMRSTISKVRVDHVISNEMFYVISYGDLEVVSKPIFSIFDSEDYKSVKINPFNVFIDEYEFMFAISDRICDSFSRELEKTGWVIKQEIPVSLPMNYNAIYKKSLLIQEAFYIIKTKVNYNSCWIKAGLSFAHKRKFGCWKDIHCLWESGQSQWGIFTDLGNTDNKLGQGVARSDYISHISESIVTLSWNSIQLITVADCILLLILPGGFVIKGELRLSETELLYLTERYG